MDETSSLADFTSHSALAETPTHSLEEENQSEADHVCDYYDCGECWDDGFSSWSMDGDEREMDSEFADANPIFDFYGMKARRASRHTVKRSRTALARRQRTTKSDVSRANRSQEPIGSRNNIWREALEKGALATYVRRRCRCEYCVLQVSLVQDRRILQWAVRRAQQGKDWGRGRVTTNKKPRWPQWVDYDWDVGYEDGDAGESWDGAESALRPRKVPPMEASLSELIQIPRPWFRRAAQFRLPPYPGLARRGTKGSLSVTDSDPLIVSSSLLPDSRPSRCDDDWDVLSLFSEWDGCSVQSL